MVLNYCSICGIKGLVGEIWIRREGVPHGVAEHNVAYTSTNLQSCPQCKRGWLQHFSHDCWHYYEDEPWDMYWWYMLESEDMQRIDTLLERCPTPLDPQCSCDLHCALRDATRNLYGGVKHRETIPLRQKIPFASLSLVETEKGLILKVK